MNTPKLLAVACSLAASLSFATETQNTDIRVLPAPEGGVAIDGDPADWDLSCGVFACGELEHLRDQYALWVNAMHDDENFYLLVHWIDPTPLNNTETFGGHGFNADSLQFRTILFPGTPDETALWWMFWQDATGRSVGDRSSPGPKDGRENNIMENLRFALDHGAKQAFKVDADGKGYFQEIAVPWKLMSACGRAPAIGDRFRLTVHANFTAGSFGRLEIRDIFDSANPKPNRVFTWVAYNDWGWATLVGSDADRAPQPVLTADGRSFPVSMRDGAPVVDWTGLIRRFEWPGFEDIVFDMPFDGTVSLNIYDEQGRIVRHLLNGEHREKGAQITHWDGLDDAIYRTPGHPVAAGAYTWKALVHPDAALTFRGFASYGGEAPWQGKPTDIWLGDHGVPTDVATDGERIFLACNGAEGGRHLLATDFEGHIRWSLQNTSGLADPEHIAVGDGFVYVLHPVINNPAASFTVAKVNAATGAYTAWADSDSHLKSVESMWNDAAFATSSQPNGIAAGDGKLFLSVGNAVAVLDASTGTAQRLLALDAAPGALHFVNANTLLAVVANGIVAIDPATGAARTVVDGVKNISRVTASADGATIYASLVEPDMQVAAYDFANGRELRRYGVRGGHPRIGRWNPDGMIDPAGIAVDAVGQLWVMERYFFPKRVSVWKLDDGSLVRDFFGPTHYGASGAAINPRDRNLMVGEACEWRLDPVTGKSECLGAFDNTIHGFTVFRDGPDGRQFLFANKLDYGNGAVVVFERLGDADYRVLAEIDNMRTDASGARATEIWIDRNLNGERDAGETESYPHPLFFAGSNSWSLNLGPDLALYGFSQDENALYALAPNGFAENGAPLYTFAGMRAIPNVLGYGRYEPNYGCAMPDSENKVMLVNLIAPDRAAPQDFVWHAFDMQTWQPLWTYPNPFFQVHRSHNAPAPDDGLFRGAYGPIGAVSLPATGPFWVINGNLGEWNILTSSGFFLTRLFSGNVFEWDWPEPVPGADMTHLPPGGGGEDFGGSAIVADDGGFLVQAGKMGIWNIEVEHLDESVMIEGGAIELDMDDTLRALQFREAALQTAAGASQYTIHAGAVNFSGDFGFDFRDCAPLDFAKTPEARVRAAAAYDDSTLYLGWEVTDDTPWVNGAGDPAQLYACGDTVDFQIGADPDAAADRADAAKGDLRLSIGNFGDKPTAVLYRFVCDEKKPRLFSSGVVQGYQVDNVEVLSDAVVSVLESAGHYTVEASIPLAALGLKPDSGLKLRGDFGATHGNPSGDDTRLRTHWANQQTGLTDDIVFELQVHPSNWGTLIFE